MYIHNPDGIQTGPLGVTPVQKVEKYVPSSGKSPDSRKSYVITPHTRDATPSGKW